MTRDARIGIDGLGRVGSTLALAMSRARLAPRVWDRSPRARSAAGRRLGAARVCRSRDELHDADLVVLCAPDGALPSLAPPGARPPGAAVHTSGLEEGAVLRAYRDAGWTVGSWHPLRSFARRWPSSFDLTGTVFAIEAPAPLSVLLRRVTRSLGGRPTLVRPGRKVLYHAGAALAANHGLLLADAGISWMRRAGLSEPVARAGVAALVASAASNLAERGAARGLTGPLARADTGAIQAHLRALEAVDPEGAELYRVTAMLSLERRGGVLRGLLPAGARRRLLRALRSPGP